MQINLFYHKVLEGNALLNLLKNNGYKIKLYHLNNKKSDISNIRNNPKSLLLIDTLCIPYLSDKHFDIILGLNTSLLLLGSIKHLHYFFRFTQVNVGFVHKNEKINTLYQSINKLPKEKKYISELVQSFFKKNRFQQQEYLLQENLTDHLTYSEIRVLNEISQNRTAKEIAERWCRSVHTIYNHRKNIMGKLELSGTFQLTKFSFQNKHAIKTLHTFVKEQDMIGRTINN